MREASTSSPSIIETMPSSPADADPGTMRFRLYRLPA